MSGRSWLLMAVPLLLGFASPCRAHVGSPDVYYESDVGSYHVLIHVQPPQAVPGRAEIELLIRGPQVDQAKVTPIHFVSGPESAPVPSSLLRDAADSSRFSSSVWLMEVGTWTLRLDLEGQGGPARLDVPVTAAAVVQLPMEPALSAILLVLAAVLVISGVGIGSAASFQAAQPESWVPSPADRARARKATLVCAALISALLFGGGRWWDQLHTRHQRALYRPTPMTVLNNDPGQLMLVLGARSWAANELAMDLVPDHGKQMHLFLIQDSGDGAFAHLHPQQLEPRKFRVKLPPLPAGTYRAYADIVYRDGFAETIPATFQIPDAEPGRRSAGFEPQDPDDSWGMPAVAQLSLAKLDDGTSVHWDRPAEGQGTVQVGALQDLRFRVVDQKGLPARLEPYMGMMGHAAIVSEKGDVFVHLHPSGTVSMASLEAVKAGPPTSQGPLHHEHHAAAASSNNEVSFPFAFQQPGRYSILMQVKSQGRVLTSRFSIDVAARL